MTKSDWDRALQYIYRARPGIDERAASRLALTIVDHWDKTYDQVARDVLHRDEAARNVRCGVEAPAQPNSVQEDVKLVLTVVVCLASVAGVMIMGIALNLLRGHFAT
ncbi:hypothetical protein QBC44DRAFT_372452 [Cladorrhinum sp. PSN332]|nr:hypothetical protein QBC44DRAFT_372452 [Cladorrhinum sp. PSN332]